VGETEGDSGDYWCQAAPLLAALDVLPLTVHREYTNVNPPAALQAIVRVVDMTNAFFQHAQPWTLKAGQKSGACGNSGSSNAQKLDQVLYITLEAVRVCATLLQPAIPDGSRRILDRIGVAAEVEQGNREQHARAAATAVFGCDVLTGRKPLGAALQKGEQLFERLELQNVPAAQPQSEQTKTARQEPTAADLAALEAIKASVVQMKKAATTPDELTAAVAELKRLKAVCGEETGKKNKKKKKPTKTRHPAVPEASA
jgi:hypothetical protein